MLFLPLGLILLLLACPAWAVLEPPREAPVEDSSSVRVEKWVEQLRSTEYLGLQRRVPARVLLRGYGRWKTDWLLPEGDGDRVRQDGRWYVSAARPLDARLELWLAAEGEHFDDRPFNLPRDRRSPIEVLPRSPEFQSAATGTVANVSAVRILRGGAGLTARPWQPLFVDLAAGPVQDRRIGRTRNGAGLWTQAHLERWKLADWEQSASLEFNRETPRHQSNHDFAARYEVYRDFYEGNSNRAQFSYQTLGRDLALDAVDRVARREERSYAIRDILTYSVTRGMQAEMTGEILHERTEQSQPGLAASSLEENQAGLSAALQGQRGPLTGELLLGLRSVSQTIRGEILQGRKSDLTLQGKAPLPGRSTLALRLGVSKYSLDTRNPNNYDDRDELRYLIESSWSKPLLPRLRYELHGLVRLDHLVYIYRQSSANNRWTRLFLVGSTISHHPTEWFRQLVRASVSANYQDYDFDTDPRTSRSTVYRKLALSDSALLDLTDVWRLDGKISWQTEEFGRLFWDSFEEERGDETRSLTTALGVVWRVTRTVRVGAGGLWDSRRGVRFPSATSAERVVFQDLKSYGPTFMAEREHPRGLFLLLNGRALRQFQLGLDDRWIISGELLGGLRW